MLPLGRILYRRLREFGGGLRNDLAWAWPLNSVGATVNSATAISVTSGVTRISCEEGQSWKLGHGALTVDLRAGCSGCSMTTVL